MIKNYHKNFRKDPCTHTRTRGVNVPARVLRRRNARTYVLQIRQYCFANISATKAPIFMKFETEIQKIVMNYQIKNRKDPCTYTGTRGVNVPARVLTRRNARAHVYASCARVCARIYTKIFVVVLYYLMNLRFKFHKDRSFRCRDICKTILTFVRSLIFNVKMV